MRRFMGIAWLFVLGWCVAGFAKTPQVLKTELDTLLKVPTGKVAKCAWTQFESGKGVIYVVSSEDGVIRKLSSTITMDAMNPKITATGQRVVYFDNAQGKVRVMDWAGTTVKDVRTADQNAGTVQAYWRDPANDSDWVVLYQNNSDVFRVNIDSKREVALANGVGDDGCSISPDGLYVAGDLGGWGVKNTTTGQVTSGFCQGGCICNIAPDNTYRISVQISGHKAVNICKPSFGSGFTSNNFNITSDILAKVTTTASCVSNDAQFEQTRWVLPDYFTFYMDNLVGNPYIFRISDKKWMLINDALGCGAGAMDLKICGGSTSVKAPSSLAGARQSVATTRCDVFSPDGRRLGTSNLRAQGLTHRGIVIRRIDGTALKASLSDR